MTHPRHKEVKASWVSALAEALSVPVDGPTEACATAPNEREPWRASTRVLETGEPRLAGESRVETAHSRTARKTRALVF